MSWMRADIFTSVMRKISNRVRGKGERKVILLMDNFSGHKMLNEHTRELNYAGGFKGFQYHNVNVLFLPLNCTSVVQPLDQGIIAAFKAHYRCQHIAFNLQKLGFAKNTEFVVSLGQQTCNGSLTRTWISKENHVMSRRTSRIFSQSRWDHVERVGAATGSTSWDQRFLQIGNLGSTTQSTKL